MNFKFGEWVVDEHVVGNDGIVRVGIRLTNGDFKEPVVDISNDGKGGTFIIVDKKYTIHFPLVDFRDTIQAGLAIKSDKNEFIEEIGKALAMERSES